ncbi:RNA polymerase sigma factor [Planctomycetota bacterium]
MNDDICAFEELFHRYKRRLFGFFYGLMLSTEPTQDYVQETFLRLWQRRKQFAHKGRFSAYLFQIAKNHYLDEGRRQKSRIITQSIAEEKWNKGLHETSLSYDGCNRAAMEEIRMAVKEAISQLPELQRLVYVLSEEQGMSYRDIAEILGCPIGTVSSRKVEAVNKLRTLLRPLRDEILGTRIQSHGAAARNTNDEVNP